MALSRLSSVHSPHLPQSGELPSDWRGINCDSLPAWLRRNMNKGYKPPLPVACAVADACAGPIDKPRCDKCERRRKCIELWDQYVTFN